MSEKNPPVFTAFGRVDRQADRGSNQGNHLRQDKPAIREKMKRIEHDLDMIIEEKNIRLDARLIRVIIALAQLNLHIWNNKDTMERHLVNEPDRYMELLKLSHQLNGVRNQLKNHLLVISGDKDGASLRSNFNTDGLDGWEMSI